jgi:hypothetical protein
VNSGPAFNALSSLQTYLNPAVIDNEGVERIGNGLRAGKLVVVREALHGSFAERMFQCLDQFPDWKLYETYSAATADPPATPFRYHHHNIYDKSVYPAELTRCEGIFASEGTRSFVEQLSGQDCSGVTSFSASWYQPGDHSCPHSDHRLVDNGRSVRTVAFVWHLTKDWRPDWGGALYWCPTLRYVPPSFNTLVLFVVTDASTHFVTQVSPYAKTKRLAINGWWGGRNTAHQLMSIDQQPGDSGVDIELI